MTNSVGDEQKLSYENWYGISISFNRDKFEGRVAILIHSADYGNAGFDISIQSKIIVLNVKSGITANRRLYRNRNWRNLSVIEFWESTELKRTRCGYHSYMLQQYSIPPTRLLTKLMSDRTRYLLSIIFCLEQKERKLSSLWLLLCYQQ